MTAGSAVSSVGKDPSASCCFASQYSARSIESPILSLCCEPRSPFGRTGKSSAAKQGTDSVTGTHTNNANPGNGPIRISFPECQGHASDASVQTCISYGEVTRNPARGSRFLMVAVSVGLRPAGEQKSAPVALSGGGCVQTAHAAKAQPFVYIMTGSVS